MATTKWLKMPKKLCEKGQARPPKMVKSPKMIKLIIFISVCKIAATWPNVDRIWPKKMARKWHKMSEKMGKKSPKNCQKLPKNDLKIPKMAKSSPNGHIFPYVSIFFFADLASPV